ncbi:hypothetical protein B7R54_10740 [Subtercola boreus]|uniref:DUF559 domain-containing protein n=1 Tax=Subtercola boreus TaxID=120213 RepID=A0A3E0VI67_9MICO|nr:hypothetical protein B7R54_10740 [Subtercola boreus]TQL53279.1 hypothetical protein FB464_0777 [Subtercola boreus]
MRVSDGIAPPGILGRCLEYAPRLRPGQYFSHETAALLWNLPLPGAGRSQATLDVSADADRTKPPTARGVRGHAIRDDRVRVLALGGLPVEDPVSAWLHLARMLSRNDLVVVGDALVFRPRFPRSSDARPYSDLGDLAARVGSYRGRGKLTLASALRLVREGVESPMETRLRLLLLMHGLPEPQVNVDLFDETGRFAGRADLYYPRQRVVVEYDGEQHRLSRATYLADQKRLARLRRICSDVIRVTVDGLRSEAHLTVADVRAALAVGP